MGIRYTVQPWKGLYIACQGFITIFLRLPLWTLWYLPPFNRPRRSWSFKRTIIVKAIRQLLPICTKTGLLPSWPDHRAIVEGPNVKAVWIPAVPNLVVGRVEKWAEEAGIDSISIPGYWYEKEGKEREAGAPALPGEKVVLTFHSGCYGMQSAHPSDTEAVLPRNIVNMSPIDRALALEYRKSEPPPNPICFPAALIDAVAAYNYLVQDVGFQPENIILAGDSSGGNLVLALARYLIENRGDHGSILPRPPGGLILCSSYADIGHSDLEQKDSSIYTNQRYDMYTPTDLDFQRANFLGPFGRDGARSNPYISPGSEAPTMEPVSFVGFPRTLNLVGGLEILRDQNRGLNAKMLRDMGEHMVTYVEFPDAIHNFVTLPWHEPEYSESYQVITSWLKSE